MAKYLVIICLLYAAQSQADLLCPKGVKFEDRLEVENDDGSETSLKLNGVGLKQVQVIIKVDAFYAGLYLEKTSQSASTILKSKQKKVGVIHTLMKVSRKRLVDMWDEEYERLCGSQCDKLRKFHDQFISYARDLKKGERLYLIQFKDRLEIEINNNEFFQPIHSAAYGKLLQRVLIGPDAADKKLEKGLLGKEMICKKV